MANKDTNLDQIQSSQAQKEITANALSDAMSPAALFGRRASTSSGLTFGYYGGTFLVSGVPTQIANGTISLTASATNYVSVYADGTVHKVTSAPAGWPGPLAAGASALYQIVTDANGVADYLDYRSAGSGSSGGGSVTSVGITPPAAGITATGGPVTSSGNITLALANDLAALEGLSGTGIVERTGTDTYALRTRDTDGTLAANSDTIIPSQKAIKTYVDTQIDGRSWKQIVRVATTANGTLATAFANGQVIDGVTLATGDRILLKDQTSGSENGIYVVAASGAPTRSTDADTGTEMVNATVGVSAGTVNSNRQYTCTTAAPITIGSTTLVFAQTNTSTTYSADETTLHLSGTQFQLLSTAPVTHAASGKTTPVDADEFGIVDSAASNVLKKLTWANLKATLWTAWGALIAAGTQKSTPVDADKIAIADSAASNATKYTSLSNIKSVFKSYFDTLYATSPAAVGGSADLPHGYTLTKKGVVVTRGASSSWKESRVESPNVFWDRKIGKYRMIFNGYSGTPSSPSVCSLGYATSTDLINWTEYGSNPFLTRSLSSGAPDENGASGGFVFQEGGTYYLFYIGFTATGFEAGTKTICLATSTDFSTWTRLGAIITTQASTWRSYAVWHPCVVKRGSTYYLFFNASSNSTHESIGYATSTDLLTWTVDDTNSPLIDVVAATWESVRVGDPFVYRIGDVWYMKYYGSDGTLSQDGIATTTDASFPLGWVKYASNPILTVGLSGSFDDAAAARPAVWITPTRHYHWYSSGDGSSPELVQIALAVDDTLNPQPSSTGVTYIGCQAYNDGTQSISNNSSTAVTFNTESWDTNGIHDTSSNTSRFTIPTGLAGKWRFSFKVNFPSAASGVHYCFLRKNGVDDTHNVIGSTVGIIASGQDYSVNNTLTIDLAVGDYIELFVYQNTGGSISIGKAVATDRGLPCIMEAQFIG